MEDNRMSDTRALVAESLSAIDIGRPDDDKLIDILAQIIDQQVASILRRNLEDRKTPASEPSSSPSAAGAQRAASRPAGRKSGG
jgi:hypothetical protein